MSLVSDVNYNLDNLVQSCLKGEHAVEWIPYSEITDIKPSPTDAIHNAMRKETLNDGTVDETLVILLYLGNSEACTSTFVSEFARIYSLPTHKYIIADGQFRRHSRWVYYRNYHIKGFTNDDDNYYMVAWSAFYHCYSRYGFCTACGILRCSPVWCICGHTASALPVEYSPM